MTKSSPVSRYEFRVDFRAPLPFVYAWCTDYTPEDARLEKENYTRRILRRTSKRVIYEDLDDQPTGWIWSHQVVDLHPPNRWHAEATGSHRSWSIEYKLSSRPDGGTVLWFRGRRRATPLGSNVQRKRLERNLRVMWKNFARALERDYRTSQRRSKTLRP